MSSPLPDEIKKEIRSVLLSKVGGIPIRMFIKDYTILCGHRMECRKYGYKNLIEMFQDIPEVARVVIDPVTMEEKVYGITNDTLAYVNATAKRAQFKPKPGEVEVSRISHDKKPTKQYTQHMSDEEIRQYAEENIQPNLKGQWALCLRRSPDLVREDVSNIFSEFGEIQETGFTPRYVFIRYGKKSEAVKAFVALHEKYEVRLPTERNSPHQLIKENGVGGQPRIAIKKSSNIVELARDNRESIEVFYGNLPKDITISELWSMVDGIDVKDIKMRGGNEKRFAFMLVDNPGSVDQLVSRHRKKMFRGHTLVVQQSYKNGGKVQPTPEDEALLKSFTRNSPTQDEVFYIEPSAGDVVHVVQAPAADVRRVLQSPLADDDEMPPLEDDEFDPDDDDENLPPLEDIEDAEQPIDSPVAKVNGRGQTPISPIRYPDHHHQEKHDKPTKAINQGIKPSLLGPHPGAVVLNSGRQNQMPRSFQGHLPNTHGFGGHEAMHEINIKQQRAAPGYIPPNKFKDPDKSFNFKYDSGKGEPDIFELFVANLPPSVTVPQLMEVFSIFEATGAMIKIDSRKSTIAFIQFDDYEKAVDAFVNLDDTEFCGRTLRISFANNTIASEDVVQNRLKNLTVKVNIKDSKDNATPLKRQIQMGDTELSQPLIVGSPRVPDDEESEIYDEDDLCDDELYDEDEAYLNNDYDHGNYHGYYDNSNYGYPPPHQYQRPPPPDHFYRGSMPMPYRGHPHFPQARMPFPPQWGPPRYHGPMFRPPRGMPQNRPVRPPSHNAEYCDSRGRQRNSERTESMTSHHSTEHRNNHNHCAGDGQHLDQDMRTKLVLDDRQKDISSVSHGNNHPQNNVVNSTRTVEQRPEVQQVPEMMRTKSLELMMRDVCPEDRLLTVGDMPSEISVLVVYKENEQYFWAHVLNDGFIQGVEMLHNINKKMAADPPKPGATGNRVVVQYEGEWTRAWVCGGDNSRAKIMYVDYGNTGVVSRSSLHSIPDVLWKLAPQAVPFKLKELPATSLVEFTQEKFHLNAHDKKDYIITVSR